MQSSEMGSGASKPVTKILHIQANEQKFAVEFTTDCSSQDIKDLLLSTAGKSRCDIITLTNPEGYLVPISSSLPANSSSSCYKLTILNEQDKTKEELLEEIQEDLKKNYCKKEEMEKLAARLDRDYVRAIEVEKCKLELKSLLDRQDAMQTLQQEQQALQMQQQLACSSEIYQRFDCREIPHILTPEMAQALKKPCFDIWRWEPREMMYLMEHMYRDLGITEELKIDPVTLRKWLLEIRDNYRDNPFHNFRHGFCVTQMMYGMISICDLAYIFSKLELGVLLTAAACHDLDHPGFSNSYQINARTELAITYNNSSPLENHHCAVAFRILENPETNIFANVSTEEWEKIKEDLTDLILSTDMAKHADIVQSFKEVVEQGIDFDNEMHRKKVKMMLIKCCDVSNEVRPMEVSEPWVDCLLQEYFRQGDVEKKEGLPVQPFMDREKVTKPKAQIGFIKFVLIPTFQLMKEVFPAVEEHMLKPLQASLDRYKQLKMVDDVTKEIEEQTTNDKFVQAQRKISTESYSGDSTQTPSQHKIKLVV